MWRRILPALIVLLLTVSSTAAQDGGLEATTRTKVKLRAGPGTDWAILGVVEAGETVRLDGRAPYENLWVRGITTDGRIGWIFGENITAPIDQLYALRAVWVDDPFNLAAPPPATPAAVTEEAPLAPAGDPPNYAVISGITAHARQIFQHGQELGNRANVFSKVGDSITATAYFLRPIGWGMYNLRSYSKLQPVIDFFSSETAREGNSFANPSIAANNGWTTQTALDSSQAWPEVCFPGDTPLACEYKVVRPAVALIMLGTNDMASLSPEVYRTDLSIITQTSIDMGVIPILSTIPMRQGYETSVPIFNQIIVETAHYYDVPLWDYASALQGLPNDGLWDGIHPSFPPSATPDNYPLATDFTPENLGYGITVRNLTALQALDAVWRRAMK